MNAIAVIFLSLFVAILGVGVTDTIQTGLTDRAAIQAGYHQTYDSSGRRVWVK